MGKPQFDIARSLRWLQLSTSIRLLLILFAVLLPLALLATYAAQQVSENAAEERTRLITDTVEESAKRMNGVISSDIATLISYADRMALAEDIDEVCPRAQRRFAALRGPTGGVLFAGMDNSGPICELGNLTPGFRSQILSPFDADTRLLPDNIGMVVQGTGRNQYVRAVVYYPAENLLKIADPIEQLPMSELTLSSDARDLQLTVLPAQLQSKLDSNISAETAVLGLNLGLNIARPRASSPEFFAFIIPFVMMIAAAVIGWWVVNHMLMRPMSKLRYKMTHYKTGETLRPMQARPFNAAEIVDLDNVFNQLTHDVAKDKLAIDKSLKQQVALTREVHHRVKNNLQIVASLISLHSRVADTPSASRAYETIQRRVDALSVVHRNHHADTEENKGIGLRALINEIINSFRTSDTGGSFARNAQVDIENINVSQDTAMPVAFLLTEILELLQLTGDCTSINISVGHCNSDDKSGLLIQSDGLKEGTGFDELLADGIDRVILGLSRQLRAELIRDKDKGTLCIDIPVIRTGGEANLTKKPA